MPRIRRRTTYFPKPDDAFPAIGIPDNFRAVCKTSEFSYRLNLPVEAAMILGEKSLPISLEIGDTGLVYEAQYTHRLIKRRNSLRCISGGWKVVASIPGRKMGDTVHFRCCLHVPYKFQVYPERDEVIDLDPVFDDGLG